MYKINKALISKTIKALNSRGFKSTFVNNKEEARDIILRLLPQYSTIGIGDSTTLYQIGIIPKMELLGYKIVNPFQSRSKKISEKKFEALLRESIFQDIFITGANALTRDGLIISIDGGGFRVAGTVYARKVILVVGQNKIVKNLNEAFQRIQKVISPSHAKNRAKKTPCVIKGECVDCRAKDRICNIMVILEGEPFRTEVNIIVIGEDLGLGWDPKWTNKRIEAIRKNYIKNCWKPVN